VYLDQRVQRPSRNLLNDTITCARRGNLLLWLLDNQKQCPALLPGIIEFVINVLHWFRHVRTRSNGFNKTHACLNLGPNVTFGSSCNPDFEPNFGQVRRSSGSNRSSEPNYGSTIPNPDNPYTILHIYKLNSISNPMLYAEGKYPDRLCISRRPLKIGTDRVTRKEASACMLLGVRSP
jgi:hypothetical protein